MIKVAIITRTKDRSLLLARAIESVESQTYTEYVHVIVNDGGDQDDVERVVASFRDETQSAIKIFHREEPSNAPDTIFNESIDRVESEYFVIHDDDDTWHPEFLSQTVAHLDENKDVAAVVTRCDKVVEEISGDVITRKKVTEWMPDVRAINLYRQCIDNQFTPIATLFRRSAYEDVGKFDTTLPVVGDWEFGVRLLKKYDADFIDPGYALASYHHRRKVGSSDDAISSDEKHRYYTNLVMNRYLRQELIDGRLGVGYIMSSLKYSQTFTAAVIRRVLPKGLVQMFKKRISN